MSELASVPSPFRPEERFLLAACSVATPEARLARLGAAAAEGLEGPRLVDLALKNRVLPLVWKALGSLDGAGLDGRSLELARAHARQHRARTLVHVQELLGLLERLEAAGVRAVPYKGPVLAARLYDDLGERQFYDLDVLVRPEDLPRAAELVRAQGFEPLDLPQAAALEQRLAEDCELHFRHPGRDVLLELHWEALPRRHRRGFRVGDVWERFEPGELAGRRIEGFAPEDLLLVLCIHGGEKHRWNRLQMLCDVARILARDARARVGEAPLHGAAAGAPLDWDVVLERARALGRVETVELGVLAAALLLDAPLPPELAHVGERPALLARAAATAGRVLRLDSGLVSHATWRAYARALASLPAATGRAPGLVGYLDVVLRPEWTDRQALALPRGLGFLYWLYRPLRLLGRHGTDLLGRV